MVLLRQQGLLSKRHHRLLEMQVMHNKLNGKFRGSHPPLYKFVGVLQLMQQDVDRTLRQIAHSVSGPVRRRAKYVKIDDQIREARLKYADGKISRDVFLDSISHLLRINLIFGQRSQREKEEKHT